MRAKPQQADESITRLGALNILGENKPERLLQAQRGRRITAEYLAASEKFLRKLSSNCFQNPVTTCRPGKLLKNNPFAKQSTYDHASVLRRLGKPTIYAGHGP